MDIKSFKEAAEFLKNRGYCVSFETKKYMIECTLTWNENGHFDNCYDEDQHVYAYLENGTCYADEEVTRTIARKAAYIEYSDPWGWAIFIGRYCTTSILTDAYENGFGWYIENAKEWEAEQSDSDSDSCQGANTVGACAPPENLFFQNGPLIRWH